MKNIKKYFLFLIALLVFLGFDKVEAAQWATKECSVDIKYNKQTNAGDAVGTTTKRVLYLINVNGETKIVDANPPYGFKDGGTNNFKNIILDYNSSECPMSCDATRGVNRITCEGTNTALQVHYYPSKQEWTAFAENSNVSGGNQTTYTMITDSNSFKIYRYFKVGGKVAREESRFLSNDEIFEVIMEIVESSNETSTTSYLKSWANVSSYNSFRTLPLFLNEDKVIKQLSTRYGHQFYGKEIMELTVKGHSESKKNMENLISQSEKYKIGSSEINRFKKKYDDLIASEATEENCSKITEITEFKKKIYKLYTEINNAHSLYNINSCGSSTCDDENVGTANFFDLPTDFINADVNEIYANITSGRTLEPSVKQQIIDEINDIKRINSTYSAEDIAFRNELNGAFDEIKATQDEVSSWSFEKFKEECEEEVKEDDEVNADLGVMSSVFTNNIKYNEIAIDHYKHDYSGSLDRCEDIIGEDMKEFLQRIFDYVKILVPGALIALGSFDFAKAVLAADADNMKKAQKTFLKRCIIAVAIFFIPTIVMALLDMINSTAGTCGIK